MLKNHVTQKNFLISFYAICLVLLTNLLNEIQFNSVYIKMWLSSLHIFEEKQFYEKIKGETFNSINL